MGFYKYILKYLNVKFQVFIINFGLSFEEGLSILTSQAWFSTEAIYLYPY